jgi:septal ring-binding cell division protein DamX
MAVSRSIWQNIQQYSWLFFSIACLVAALIFWAVTDRDALVEVDHPSKNEAQVEIKSEKVTATTNLGALTNEVKPLDLTTRVVVSNEHAPEFRGTKFISENQRQWVVEIFRSSDEAIVKNFLLSRADRNKFSYFRLSGDQQVEQYVLAYGLFPNAEEAKRQFSQLNLVLPKSIHPTIQQLSTYILCK